MEMNKTFILTKLNELEMVEREMPKPQKGEVLVKLGAIGVCGSDVHYYDKGRIGSFVVDFPFVLGHECAGTIVGLGEGVDSFSLGDKVALEPGVPCGKCEMCKTGHYNLCPDVRFLATPPIDGCLMEYITFPAEYTFKLPKNMTVEQGALVEPTAIGMNAALTGQVKAGDTVLIMGAGCIGLVSLLAAKAFGAAKVIVSDVISLRLEAAKKLGAYETIDSKEQNVAQIVSEITDGKGVDVVIDCAGFSETVRSGIQCAKAAGRIVIVGMGVDELNGIPLGPISTKELVITSIFRYKNLYPRTIAAIESGSINLEGIVSKRYSFEDSASAFSDACNMPTTTIKNVILFD